MDATSLLQISKWADGTLEGPGEARITAVNTDSRSLQSGELFVALKGETFDGHTFIPAAAKLGAAGAISSEPAAPGSLPGNFALIRVGDTLTALQRLAGNYRKTLPARIVGVTGSNGKTTTKDFTAAILSRAGRTFKTEGNLNNHIGVPLTVLRASSSDELGVVEVGMNHPGELAPLIAIARPEAAIITNVGMAHIEFMGSRETIALEKATLAEAIPAEGIVAIGADNDFIDLFRSRTKARMVVTGIGAGEISASDVVIKADCTLFNVHAEGQSLAAFIPVPGEHMVRNALLAIAVGLHFGIPLAECIAGLRDARMTKGRIEQKEIRGLRIIDDSYNASPDSMIAALNTVAKIETKGRRIAVLGRMLELGDQSESGHRMVGEAAALAGFNALVGIGEEAAWITDAARSAGLKESWALASHEQAVELLRQIASPGDLLLVKGSRGARMERVIEGLQALDRGGKEAAI